MTDKRSDSTAREIRGEFLEEQKREDKRKAIGYEIQLLITILVFSLGIAVSLIANVFGEWSLLLDVNTISDLKSSFFISFFIKLVILLFLELVVVILFVKVFLKITMLREGKYV